MNTLPLSGDTGASGKARKGEVIDAHQIDPAYVKGQRAAHVSHIHTMGLPTELVRVANLYQGLCEGLAIGNVSKALDPTAAIKGGGGTNDGGGGTNDGGVVSRLAKSDKLNTMRSRVKGRIAPARDGLMIPRIGLVDMICAQGGTISDVCRKYRWPIHGRNSARLKAELKKALQDMAS